MAFKNPIEQAQALTLTNPQAAINGGTPTIQAKPQRFARSPRLEDYGLKYDEGAYKNYRDSYYYHEPDDIDKELEKLKQEIAKNDKYSVEYAQKRLNALSDPNLQKYLRDRNAYSSQFEKDYNEFYPTAKEAVIRKLLGDGELYRTRVYGKDDYRDEIDDIGDSINAEFAKKYGYKERYGGELFSPLRKHGGLYSALGNEEDAVETPDGRRSYRTPYNKGEYIGELLRSGELTLDDLKRYILGK